MIGTSTAAPYSFSWTGVAAGSYSLTAVATNDAGMTTTSSAVAIAVDAPPGVALTGPVNGASFTAPANIPIAASASDTVGTVTKVDFYQGGTLIITLTAAPYSFTWTNVPAGNYSLTAVATNDAGTSATSAAVTIAVNSGVAQIYYIHPDHLNTPRLIADSTGTTVWRWDQGEPFGNDIPNGDPSNTGNAFDFPLRFPGQYFDRETGLSFNVFRDYDPAIGRYVESDPIGLGGGLNSYVYVGSNPLSLTDPFGLAESGPYHPPEDVSLRCTQADTCPQLQGKMQVLERMIRSHQGWDWNNPPPRGGGRHATEIAELWRAYARCQAIWEKKCVDCPPEENAYSKWWRSLTDPKPKPVPDPAEELSGQNPRRQIPGAPGGPAGPSTTLPIRILP